MPLGITNTTVISLENITQLANVTEPMDFFRNVNHVIYSDYLYFLLFCVLWIIIFITANKVNDQPMNNFMYSSAILSVLVFFGRAMSIVTDIQMWIFPIVTAIAAMIIWMTKE